MLGILVAVVKLVEMAQIIPGLALWSFALLIFVLAGAAAALDPRDRLGTRGGWTMSTGRDAAPSPPG